VCRLKHPISQSKNGTAMTCACGRSPTDGHKQICICSRDKQQDSHFRCQWKLRVDIPGPDFLLASIYVGSRNEELHPEGQQPQVRKQRKVPETVTDKFDEFRWDGGRAPHQFAYGVLSRFVRRF
jgi:hypothetical protein